MSEPLDLESIRAYTHAMGRGGDWADLLLLAEVERLRAELARQAEQITAVRALFAGGPDTPCATTWRYHHDGWTTPRERTECVEVPMEDLRAALDGST